ncbi:MAG: MBL fold metallo-hydrolase [Deltaproteobacteria bacterium]|nr:MBL fold metallo-hydrolase [Deltaproteobacteria bacterium]
MKRGLGRIAVALCVLGGCGTDARVSDTDADTSKIDVSDTHESDTTESDTDGSDSRVSDTDGSDTLESDSRESDTDVDDTRESDVADTSPCAAPLPAPPSAALRPVAGELFYAQLGLGGFKMGESALLVGPDGTSVLIDVGNDSHDDDVAERVLALTGRSEVDHLVLTHFHGDHLGGLADLMGRIAVTRSIVHRGLTDLTAAANADTFDALCTALAEHPALAAPLCSASAPAPCKASNRQGSYPAIACPGLTTFDVSLGGGARMDFIAANGFMGDRQFTRDVGPMLGDDTNGENARSAVAVIAHGAFRMLVAGDLTGGGSDTDDLESFYVPGLDLAGISARGVDVLHAGHHGRNTSTNATWADRLLPRDGRDRNAVMGISTAHLLSPHAETLATLLDGDRLGQGRAWTTTVTVGGATAAGLVDAEGGMVLVATLDGGAAYAVQAVDESGRVLESRVFRSVGSTTAICP